MSRAPRSPSITRCGILPDVTDSRRSVLALLLDRSSSLAPIRDDLRTGLTELLEAQRALDGELLLSVARTGNHRSPALKPAEKARLPRLGGRGTQPVRDSLGRLVTDLGAVLAALPEEERPGRVFVLTVRGLLDEGSATWGPDELRDLVAAQERDYAWEFLTITVGEHASLAPWGAGHRSIGVTPTGPAVRSALTAAAAYLTRAREAGPWTPVPGFSQAERYAAYPPAVDEPPTQSIPALTADRLAEEDRAAHARWWSRLLPSGQRR